MEAVVIKKGGKMVIYRCDLCKTTEIPRGNQLIYREQSREKTISWDVCSECFKKNKRTIRNW